MALDGQWDIACFDPSEEAEAEADADGWGPPNVWIVYQDNQNNDEIRTRLTLLRPTPLAGTRPISA
ncbi:unnamed protein product [Fusarium venenatum]|uniref:Uncharacterized protein n=1 Tax=Fusarium venenatum TaxID=56646 RepID=A0A2L2T5H6_9HYPO|nr:uncharacterized protein FVRRES_01610 [Fusarium venenatum]CEI65098.1 unnamed protein product [Fusarium venenatum]